MGKLISKLCKALDTEEPKNENANDLMGGLAMCWAMALLGWFVMWLVYGG